ncbi:MAG: hypothetical protein LQ338_008039 [Usnochroma carphineum]|nr:MAG: hypothetical protein LQ338_008039 [Usnochroma carphineum]
MTSVLGHLTGTDFPSEYKRWQISTCQQLFDARVITSVDKDKEPIARNITQQARYSKALFIWTDCDREGEHIGSEVRQAALEGKPGLEVKRAVFSNTERGHVLQAAQRPIPLDERQVNAVTARIELDLRLGVIFTRFQTLVLRTLGGELANNDRVISYVDRYFRVKNFVPEHFWSIRVMHHREDVDVTFLWQRHRLFDRMSVTIFFERCLSARLAKVTKLQNKPTSHWRPLPLTTVELQKLGSSFLRMDSQRVMKVAEDLYNKGWISYPRTETDQFDRGMDLKRLVEKQTQDNAWGPYARELLNGAFRQPRGGHHNDQAHPPIHPVNYVALGSLSDDERRVYEFVVRRFLACCSDDAKGELTTVEIEYGSETFFANGLLVLQKNYLLVYPYDKWESSQQLPRFTFGETFEPTEANMSEGETGPPGYLTEPELISLMDANGIGTDATMAEHIAKIKEREYVMTQTSGGNGQGEAAGRGGREGRGGRRGGRSGNAGRGGGNQRFIPTTLGVALIEGYDSIGLETSLGKPFLRKEMEIKMKEICAGTKSRNDFVQETLEQYRHVFIRTQQQVELLKAACRKYVLGEGD